MVRIWAVLFGLTVAIVAGLFVQATFAKATEKLGGNASGTSPSNLEIVSHSGGDSL